MANAITITDPRTIELIEREASRLGLSEVGYLARLVSASATESQENVDSPLPREVVDARIARAKAILADIHPHVTDADRAFDYDAWLYDENGLPR